MRIQVLAMAFSKAKAEEKVESQEKVLADHLAKLAVMPLSASSRHCLAEIRAALRIQFDAATSVATKSRMLNPGFLQSEWNLICGLASVYASSPTRFVEYKRIKKDYTKGAAICQDLTNLQHEFVVAIAAYRTDHTALEDFVRALGDRLFK